MEENDNKNLAKTTEKGYEISVHDLFRGDGLFVFVYKKTQKILSALYLITNLLSHHEPIKWHLRKKGGTILSDIIVFFNSKNEADLNNVRFGVLEVLSMLEVAEHSGAISPMNSKIIRAELGIVIETISKDLENRFVIPSNFFDVPEILQDVIKYEKEGMLGGARGDKGQNAGHKMSFSTHGAIGHDLKKNREIKDIKSIPRKAVIISIIKKTREVSTSDIKVIMPGCSDKTIQRDLLALVKEGVLKKIGERRWSRYSIR